MLLIGGIIQACRPSCAVVEELIEGAGHNASRARAIPVLAWRVVSKRPHRHFMGKVPCIRLRVSSAGRRWVRSTAAAVSDSLYMHASDHTYHIAGAGPGQGLCALHGELHEWVLERLAQGRKDGRIAVKALNLEVVL